MIDTLIVEDDPMVTEFNKSYLQMVPGFRLIGQVANGEDALHFLYENSVSLLLLDVFMPKLDGLELLNHIRQSYPKIDIIMVTADRNADNIQKALRLGVIDYIVKPFSFERFRTSLVSYQERLRLLNSSNTLNQSQLDQRIFSKQIDNSKSLPKGIDPETLEYVRGMIEHHAGDFSMSDLTPHSNLSRISLKKYIDYLEGRGEISSYLVYLSVGRPVRMYVIKKIHHEVKPFHEISFAR